MPAELTGHLLDKLLASEWPSRVRCRHHDPGIAAGVRFGPGHDLHVLAWGVEEVHQALDRKPLQVIVRQRRDFRLVDAQQSGGFGLGMPPLFENPVDGKRQEDRRLPLAAVG
jgi:hypothetical protein